MAPFILNSPKFTYREEPLPGRTVGKLVIVKRGDEVELDDEQVERLQAGQPGSTFLTKEQFEKANRETFPEAIADEDWPTAQDAKIGRAAGDSNPLPGPVSTTAATESAGVPLAGEEPPTPVAPTRVASPKTTTRNSGTK